MPVFRYQVALASAALLSAAGGRADMVPRSSALIRSLRSTEPGLILAVDQGERRVRRAAGGAPFTIKVDPLNGGSPDLVMGYEVLPPGHVSNHTTIRAPTRSCSSSMGAVSQSWVDGGPPRAQGGPSTSPEGSASAST